MARIAVDSRWMVGNYRGMGKFAHMLLEPVRDRTVLLGHPGGREGDAKVVEFGLPLYPAWEQASLPRYVASHGFSHLVCPYNTAPVRLTRAVKLILVVHDLIFMEPLDRLPRSASTYQNVGRLYRRLVVPSACRRADRIVTVSDHSKHEIVRRLGVRPEHITVIPNALPHGWIEPVLNRAREPFLLSVTGGAPSKNLRRLFYAFARLVRQCNGAADLKLHVVGVAPAGQRVFRDQAESLDLAERVIWHDFIDETHLRQLYDHCLGFVFPSLIEGFGIPLIEAMARATPIIASRASVIPEVCGEAAVYFDPTDVDDMAAKLAAFVTDADGRRVLGEKGRSRARIYSSAAVNERVCAFWDSIL